ncbi:NADH-flavin reductase [Citricoccus zhacaiensis]|uniref:NADH-flavin reductase n=1 Tax=Citricoccus zhacaiensis TaxID=489142 RepID=A0ABQ2LSE5_9MICC|nr:NAD(P)H-binding protein [Citricoccus zhacaiensis]GGO42619.1 NADH-flavin reductase [Citricoccus zhacaiensis]
MKIGIIGATGMAGQEIYREAVRRGEEAVALVRDAAKARELLGSGAAVVEKDAFDLTSADLAGFDAVVDAFGTSPDQAHTHNDLVRQLVQAAPASNQVSPRLLFILGAGSLTNPETGRLAIEDIRKAPGSEAWISIPEAALEQLEYLRTVDSVDWVGVSPQMMFTPGEATTPQVGQDSLLTAADGGSHTTAGTMAVGILDELQNPVHHNTRFTVSDA